MAVMVHLVGGIASRTWSMGGYMDGKLWRTDPKHSWDLPVDEIYQLGTQQKRRTAFLYITYQRNAAADGIDSKAQHAFRCTTSWLEHLYNPQQPSTYISKEVLTVKRSSTSSTMMFWTRYGQ